MTTDFDADVRRFIGKYDDVDLETGVQNVKERKDVGFRETEEYSAQSFDSRSQSQSKNRPPLPARRKCARVKFMAWHAMKSARERT